MDTEIVVPCYNESERLDADAFCYFAQQNPRHGFLFVDDGSRDGTPDVLRRVCRQASRSMRCVLLQRNVGKAEAVRRGLIEALSQPSIQYVGFWDADLATPLDLIPAFTAALEKDVRLVLVMGARVEARGTCVRQRWSRRVASRIFAAAASATLSMRVSDTQCGAKLFRANELTRQILARPFRTRWIFDVEVLARMRRYQRQVGGCRVEDIVHEVPLPDWRDVAGSKRRPMDYLLTVRDLFLIKYEDVLSAHGMVEPLRGDCNARFARHLDDANCAVGRP